MKKILIHFIFITVILLSGSLADARLKCSPVQVKKTSLTHETSELKSPTVMPEVLLFGV